MDDIFDFDIINTAQLLKLDRLLVLTFKYEIFPTNVSDSYIPKATVKVTYDWYHHKNLQPQENNFSYSLSQSFFTLYGWQKAPEVVKIKNRSQLEKFDIQQEIEAIFELDLLESLIIIPLCKQRSTDRSKPLVLGLLILQTNRPHRWQMAEIETGKWMAKQITSALLNAQTVAKVQSLVDERTAQLRMSLDVQAKLGQKLRNNVEELRRVNRVKDEFIASLSDALKTPLSNMKMGVTMLRLMIADEQSLRYLDILSDECEKEIKLVNNLLTLQELEANKLTIEPQKIYLKPLFDEYYQEFSAKLEAQQNKLVIENEQEYIYTDLNSLNLILKELITNALKFSVAQTDIVIKIYSQQSDTIIQISNYGSSLSVEEQENIFQPFYQGQAVENVTNSGTGLGLALVESLVKNLDGQIDVSSLPTMNQSEHYQNIFTITFPWLMNDNK